MNIAILTPSFYRELKEIDGYDRIVFGGAERYIIDLCLLLKSFGHEPVIYQAYKANDEIKTELIMRMYKGIKIVCIRNTSGFIDGVNIDLNSKFNQIADHFDLRIYFTTYLCYPVVVHPCISICHGIYFDYPQHEFQLTKDRQQYFEKILYGFYAPDVCVSVDSNTKRVIQAMDPARSNKIKIVNNYVDCTEFNFVNKNFSKINVLFSRRLDYLRGFNDFCRSAVIYPECNYLAVGQSSSIEMDKDIQEKAKSINNLSIVFNEMSEMVFVYNWAHISVIPTKACEGLSLSLLESMAAGLAIITTNAGGINDAVIDGYNAVIYDPDHEKLESCIKYLAENKELCNKFGVRNREIAVESFDKPLWNSRWIDIIDNI